MKLKKKKKIIKKKIVVKVIEEIMFWWITINFIYRRGMELEMTNFHCHLMGVEGWYGTMHVVRNSSLYLVGRLEMF